MMRPGLPYSVATIVLAIASAIVVRETATEVERVVSQVLGLALVLIVVGLVFGLARVLASSTVPIAATIVLQSGFADNPSWIRSLVIGCLWFATVELGWEAIDRRDGSERTRAAAARRLQEVSTVVGLSLVVGLSASIATSLAPSRTVLLQAVVLCLVLAAFVMLIRRVADRQDLPANMP